MCAFSRVLITIVAAVSLFACSEAPQVPAVQQHSTSSTPTLGAAQQLSIANQELSGTIRGAHFYIEQAIIDDGTLTLRRGADFFADAEITISNFEGDLSGKTFHWDNTSGFDSPFINVGRKTQANGLPETYMITSDYDLTIIFGESTELGLPLSFRLTEADHNTRVEGQFFATFKDIRVIDNKIDLRNDSFDTLEHLAKTYLQEKYGKLKFDSMFGVSFRSFGKNEPTKTGFVGYDATDSNNQSTLFKIQLLKDTDGWRVENELANDEIDLAHPLVTTIGNERAIRNGKIRIVAALALEEYLNDSDIMKNVRSLHGDCSTNKDNTKATCNIDYGLKDTSTCERTNYLMRLENGSYVVDSQIPYNHRFDYKTGELKERRVMSPIC